MGDPGLYRFVFRRPPAATPPPAPPLMALRTYLALRLGMVAVIATLGVALLTEILKQSPNCAQGSISAYYYTSVHSIFIGALVALGVSMVVIWGKTAAEDGFLNLAGLLTPVVALVPEAPSNLCSLVGPTGDPIKDAPKPQQVKADLIANSHAAILNNMFAYFIIVGMVLLLLIGVGIYAALTGSPTFITADPWWKYWVPLGGATIMWLVGFILFWGPTNWFYDNAHKWSARGAFVCVIVLILSVSRDKHRWPPPPGEPGSSGTWRWLYLVLGVSMGVGAFVILAGGAKLWEDRWMGTHKTFAVETWLLVLLMVFWVAQTIDRRSEGAPRRIADRVGA